VIIPDAQAAKLKEAGIEKGGITMGVRPEDFHAAEERPAEGTEYQKMEARVEIIEPMGAELYLYLTTGKNPFVARTGPHIKAGIDSDLPLTISMSKVHFFDPRTELTLT